MRDPARFVARVAAIGALVAAAVAIAIAFTSDGEYEVRAVFDDVRGLIPGGEVKAGSARVGTVEDIEFNEDEMPVVTMSIDDDFRLKQGAFADIRLASNVGGVNRFIDLEQGEGSTLPDGATLGPSQTDQPVDLDLAVSELDPRAREDVAAVIAGFDRSIRGRGDDIDLAFRHSAVALAETSELLDEVNEDELALRVLVEKGEDVAGGLADGRGDLGPAAERLATALTIAAGRQAELGRTVRALGPGLSAGRQALDRLGQAIPNLRELTAAAGPAVDELRPTARTILPAFDALRPLIAEAKALIAASPAQLRKIRPVIQAALPLIRRLGPTVDRIGPLVDYLRTWGPEVVSFFTLFGDATSNYDVNGNMIRSTAIPIQAARHTNQIGPDDPGPGLVRRPYYRTPGSLEGESWEAYAEYFIAGATAPETHVVPSEEVP